MHRRVLAAAAVWLALGAVGSGARAQSRLDFQLVNRTGYEINEVYLGPVTSRSWGNDVMGDGTLPAGRQADIRFNRSAAACDWDLKVVYSDGDESEFRGLNLCNVSRVTLFWTRQAGTTRFVTE